MTAAGTGVVGGSGLGAILPGRAYADDRKPGPAETIQADAIRYDYTLRSTFDHFDQVFHESGVIGQPDDLNEQGGALAWSQSYVMHGFVRMFEAYRDTYYLDRLIHNIDLVLGSRDSVRGVTDYRGESLPAWRAARPYTVGVAQLRDPSGRGVLEVRSAAKNAEDTIATVRDVTGDDRFTLEVRNTIDGKSDTFASVSMDPDSADYVVRRVYDAYPTARMVTVGDLRDHPRPGNTPAPGVADLASQPVIFAVHTGMITEPIAAFVRLVYRDSRLRRTPLYKNKADVYLQAVLEAIAVHDPEWRLSDSGLGYYQWPKGMPVPYDGTQQPINQSTALGRTYVELAAATGDPQCHSRARSLARMFAAQISIDGGGAAIWPYYPTFSHVYQGYAKTGDPRTDVSAYTPSYGSDGVGAQQAEDLSHAAINVDFAARSFRNHIYFGGVDMIRFARAYTQNLATSVDGVATTNLQVDGRGGLAPSGQYFEAPRWMAVAPWDAAVFTHTRAVYEDHDAQPALGSRLACVANLNWYKRYLS